MFNEANTVEKLLLDILSKGMGGFYVAAHEPDAEADKYVVAEPELRQLRWKYVDAKTLPRQVDEVFVESKVRDALIRLNPEIKQQPDRADEVLYKLRALPLSVKTDGLVRANEMMSEWLKNEKTMPFGKNNEHTQVKLIDFEHPENNEFIVTNQWTYQCGRVGKRFDVVLVINGFPVLIGEAKTPVRQAVTWVDGAIQVHDDYEQSRKAVSRM